MFQRWSVLLLLLEFVPVRGQAPATRPALCRIKAHAGVVALNGQAARRDQLVAAGDRLQVEPTGWVCLVTLDGGSVLLARHPEEAPGAQLEIRAHDPAAGRLTFGLMRGMIVYSLPDDRARPQILTLVTPTSDMATRSGEGVVMVGAREDRIASRTGTMAVRERSRGQALAVPVSRVLPVTTSGLGALGAWSWEGFLRGAGPATLGVEGCLGADVPTSEASTTVAPDPASGPLGPVDLSALWALISRYLGSFGQWKARYPRGFWLVLLIPTIWIVLKLLAKLASRRTAQPPCRFCKKALQILKKIYQVGDLDSEKVWMRIPGDPAKSIGQALQQGEDRAAKTGTGTSRFEILHAFCSPCSTSELTVERTIGSKIETKRMSLRGEAHAKLF